jgi:amino acid transporter
VPGRAQLTRALDPSHNQEVQVAETAHAGQPTEGGVLLRRGVLSWFEVLAQSVSNLAPSAVIGLVVGVVAATSGAGSWLIWAIGTVVLALVAIAISYVGRRFFTTGGLYPLSGETAHPAFGHLVAWGALLGIVVGGPAVTLQFGIFFGQFLNLPAFGVPYNRWSILIICLAVVLAAGWMSWRGIKLSVRIMLVVEVFSLIVIGILMLIVLARHHGTLFESSQLTLHGVNLHEILAGGVLTVFAFSGFESATALGQESQNPKRAVPLAVIGSVVIAGIFFVFTSYTLYLGFSGSKLSLATSASPLEQISVIAGVSWYRYLVAIGVIVSMFAVVIAIYNAGSRLLLTLARERLAPAPFTRLTSHKTPSVGILLMALANLVGLAAVVAGNFNAFNSFGDISSLSGNGSATMYVVFAVGVAYYCLVKLPRRSPAAVAVAIVALLGAAGLIYVLYKTFSPFPPFPLSAYAYAYFAVLVVAFGTLFIAALRPGVLARFGGSVAGDTRLRELESADRDSPAAAGQPPA